MKRDPDFLQFRPYRAIVAGPKKKNSSFFGQRAAFTPVTVRGESGLAPRSRVLYALLVVAVIGLGLLWRSGWLQLPPMLTKYGGSVWWALMVFLGIGFLLPRAPIVAVTALAFAFACGIECSQLYHAPWIDHVRSYRLGALILGSTFNWPDIAAYAVGIAWGGLHELIFRRPRRR